MGHFRLKVIIKKTRTTAPIIPAANNRPVWSEPTVEPIYNGTLPTFERSDTSDVVALLLSLWVVTVVDVLLVELPPIGQGEKLLTAATRTVAIAGSVL